MLQIWDIFEIGKKLFSFTFLVVIGSFGSRHWDVFDNTAKQLWYYNSVVWDDCAMNERKLWYDWLRLKIVHLIAILLIVISLNMKSC